MRVLFLIIPVLFISITGNSQSFSDIFIEAGCLYPKLKNDSIVILHLDKPENYNKGHIPGAIFVGSDDYTAVKSGLYYQMPDPMDFEEMLKKRGIKKYKKIIISSGWDTFAHAFRLYLTLDYYGLSDQALILNGGIRGWEYNGFPVSQDTVIAIPAEGYIGLKEKKNILVEKEWIRSNLNNPEICIIDARKDAYYSGREKGNYQRQGHIRGAENLTWLDLVDENFVLYESDSLRTLFKKVTENQQQKLILYCHVGLRASVLYTVGKALGYEVRLYDGSFNEWDSLDPTYPVDTEK
jgi:thiosulfate/3-mercaptopyruvate sulfurtransferase